MDTDNPFIEGEPIEIARKWFILYTLIPEVFKTPDEVAVILGIDLSDAPPIEPSPPPPEWS